MKKILLFLILFPALMHAQRSMQTYYQLNMLDKKFEFLTYEESFASEKLRKELKIKEVKVDYTSSKGKKSESSILFNKAGKVLTAKTKRTFTEKVYQEDTLEINKIVKDKREMYETKTTYLNGNVATREIYKNNKLKSKTQVEYNTAGKSLKTTMKEGRKTYEIRNEYDEENKLSKSTFMVNGKIKKEWIYECKPEGQLIASKTEAISSFCTYKEESADGSYVVFTRSIQDGKPYLFKRTYNKDSLIIHEQRYKKDSLLVWERKVEGNVETSAGYKESGKLLYKQIVKKDELGRVVFKEYSNGRKSLSKSEFELNPEGTTKVAKITFRKNKTITRAYTYSFF